MAGIIKLVLLCTVALSSDDMALLAPTVGALHKLITVCECNVSDHGLLYNLRKTLPAEDQVIIKYGDGPRYQYMRGVDGSTHLVDLWLKASDLAAAAKFTPDTDNVYHLFTRANPSLSQPLLLSNVDLLRASNFDASKKTVVLLHGWLGNVLAPSNLVLIPAYLEAEDVNVIVADWNVGAGHWDYLVAVLNTVTSGESAARFINWLNSETGASPSQLTIVGHSLGGHKAGIIGRNVVGDVPYIIALDPAMPSWLNNEHKFRSTDGLYTEVIHTNVGEAGYLDSLGDVDFYPNGGNLMPGCYSQSCDHDRCFYYLAESLTSGGFRGRQCGSLLDAVTNNCVLPRTLQMGGFHPKIGITGIFGLQTNAAPPFSTG